MWLLKVFWAFLPTEKVQEQRVYEKCTSKGSLPYVFQGAASLPRKGAGTSDLVSIWWATTSVLRAHFNLQQPWSKEREGRCSHHESKPALHTIWYENPIDWWVKKRTIHHHCVQTNLYAGWVLLLGVLLWLSWLEEKDTFEDCDSPKKSFRSKYQVTCPPRKLPSQFIRSVLQSDQQSQLVLQEPVSIVWGTTPSQDHCDALT